MKRLTLGDRERLRGQLMAALLPDRAEEIRRLEAVAFKAVVTDFFTPSGLRRIATLPLPWLKTVDRAWCTPSGERFKRSVIGAPLMLPRSPPDDHTLGEATQQAVDRWWTAKSEAEAARKALAYRLDQLLFSVRTLEALLERLPEARDILKLPPAESVEAITDDVRARLAAKGGAA